MADVTTAGSQAWHALGQEDREPYHVMATASRENYHKAKEDYIQSGGRMLFELQQRNFKPKRPLTPYFLFLEKARSEANEVKVEGGAGGSGCRMAYHGFLIAFILKYLLGYQCIVDICQYWLDIKQS